MSLRNAFVLLTSLLLASCAAVQPPAPEPLRQARFESRETQLRALQSWRLYARAAINTPRDSGTVSMFWRQSGKEYTLTLRAALGVGTIKLHGADGMVRLRTSDGRRDSARDAAALVERHTGYRLPVPHLRHWVLGMPAPDGAPEMELNEQGELIRLAQAGWVIRYDDYREIGGVSMPGTIRAEGQGIELKLAVQQWDIGHREG
ncbi:outer membrane lipoprotein LolB [Ectothiorhodospiraceae bacterium WFHF3C12]|nr:outer membrane lipoprotein LolB [Ectothiorhodospiraceae bacterium WFHF3C12]